MKKQLVLGFALTLTGAALFSPKQAHACGGCFTQATQTTQVSGHRMILSVTPQATTLWDQIQYSGNPSDFAWILPVHGTVQIGLSSDGLFSLLDSLTDEKVVIPPTGCPSQYCGNSFGTGTSATAGVGGGSSGGGVSVVAQQVVGPYETVQLHATDPNALANWLSSHNYNLPADVKPVTDAYIAEGFDFLAMKLVPGQGIAAMRPVRITMPGASLSLPLRMVAAGTGAITPIKLWVVGEGRYQPTNMPTFQINPSSVVWDFGTNSSNLAALREGGFTESAHTGWLVESSININPYTFSPLTDAAQYDPVNSGYGDDPMGTNASTNATSDVAALVGTMQNGMILTRVDAELSRSALANDLELGACRGAVRA